MGIKNLGGTCGSLFSLFTGPGEPYIAMFLGSEFNHLISYHPGLWLNVSIISIWKNNGQWYSRKSSTCSRCALALTTLKDSVAERPCSASSKALQRSAFSLAGAKYTLLTKYLTKGSSMVGSRHILMMYHVEPKLSMST